MAAREARRKERVRRRARMLRMATQGEASVVYALAVNLRCLRSARGMTQEALANRAGVARSCIAMIEDARIKGPRPVTLERLARARDDGCQALGDAVTRDVLTFLAMITFDGR